MSLFNAEEGSGKLAKDLTANAILMATSKYVKNGPAPVGQYQSAHQEHARPRYGAHRQLKTKTQVQNQGNQQQTPQVITKQTLGQTPTSKKQQPSTQIKVQNSKTSPVQNAQLNINNPVQQNKIETPKTRNARGLNTNVNTKEPQQKIAQKIKTPVNSSRGRYGAQSNANKPKDFFHEVFQTPQPSARYGTNRRTQPQPKAQQTPNSTTNQANITSKLEQKNQQKQKVEEKQISNIQVSQQKPQQSIPTPKSQAASRSRVSSQISTPINRVGKTDSFPSPSIQATKTQQLQIAEQSNINSQPTPSRILSRNTGRAQLKTKQTASLISKQAQQQIKAQVNPEPKIQPKVQPKVQTRVQGRTSPKVEVKAVEVKTQQVKIQQTQPKIRPKIIIHVLKTIFNTKVSQAFTKIQSFQAIAKTKQLKFAKLWVIKVRSACNNVINERYSTAFAKISKWNNTNNNKVVRPGNFDNAKEKSKQIIVSSLHRLYLNKLSAIFKKVFPTKKISTHKNKIFIALQKLFDRKLSQFFKKLNLTVSISSGMRNKLISRIYAIMKGYYSVVYRNAFKKLRSIRKPEQKTQEPVVQQSKVSTPIANLSPQRDRKVLQNLTKQIEKNTKSLKALNEEGEKQKAQFLAKIQNIKLACEQLTLQNEDKRRLNADLKQRAQSIKTPEEDYIQETDLITDSKFPLLYEMYIHVQKSSLEDVRINDLLHSFQNLEQQMRKDPLVREWIQVQQNHWLKGQISRYEGQPLIERRAAKMANEEQQMLKQLMKGYIKQRYTWEWVKNALSSVSTLA